MLLPDEYLADLPIGEMLRGQNRKWLRRTLTDLIYESFSALFAVSSSVVLIQKSLICSRRTLMMMVVSFESIWDNGQVLPNLDCLYLRNPQFIGR